MSIAQVKLMLIRETSDADLNDILLVERAAFNRDAEVNLTRDLLVDPSAKPLLSLLAYVDGQPVGHILFSKATVVGAPNIKASFLAPLAVIPEFQKQGIGGTLINKGLELQNQTGTDLVFVLGHIAYYPKFGFTPASKLGFEPTYPLPAEVADAWMVQALRPGVIGKVSGRVLGSDTMN
ncbi:MAG: N-acetyltransferase [Candidatus Bathyarchaeota archaeon]|nr:N-acetyltransferase [Candidatus Bathyarchaeota archaeon]